MDNLPLKILKCIGVKLFFENLFLFKLLIQIGMSCFHRPDTHKMLIAPCISKSSEQEKAAMRPPLCNRTVPFLIFGMGHVDQLGGLGRGFLLTGFRPLNKMPDYLKFSDEMKSIEFYNKHFDS